MKPLLWGRASTCRLLVLTLMLGRSISLADSSASPSTRPASYDLTRLAPSLGVEVRRQQDTVWIRGPNGETWSGQLGASVLEGSEQLVVMPGVLEQRGEALYVPGQVLEVTSATMGPAEGVSSGRSHDTASGNVSRLSGVSGSPGLPGLSGGAQAVAGRAAADQAVNLTEAAADLGFIAESIGEKVIIRNLSGQEWRGVLGGFVLSGSDRSIVLGIPLVERNGAVYGPREALAGLAGLIAADRSDWRAIQVAKSDAEREAYARAFGPRETSGGNSLSKVVQPPKHGTLALMVGQGYVQGADWGNDVAGSGTIGGWQTNFWSQTTAGPRGLELLTGHAAFINRDTGLGVEGGDLFSDIWGWARGARVSWKSGELRRPSVSYYARTERRGQNRALFSYRDQFQPTRWFGAAGEVATDGSFVVRPRLRTSRFTLTPFYRRIADQSTSRGAYGSLAVFKGTSLFGGYSRSRSVLGDRNWMNYGLRMPLGHGADLRLERTMSSTEASRTGISALQLGLPLGRIRLHGRLQQRDTTVTPLGAPSAGGVLRRDSRTEFLGALSYLSGKGLNVHFQTANRWRRDGALDQWQQILATYQLSRRTLLEATAALPSVATPSQSRFRVTRQLNDTYEMVAEYGNVPSYQGIESDPEDQRLKVILRRRWLVKTPAQGGQIEGVVADPVGRPVEGVLVRLGSFSAATDETGRYFFEHVPTGEYSLSLDETSLPVDFASVTDARAIEADTRTRLDADFQVVRLNTIQGRVCLDRNRNLRCDRGEGLVRMPVTLGDRANALRKTATGREGVFSFYNLPPGRHLIVVPGRALLGKGAQNIYEFVSGNELEVELLGEKAPGQIEFLLKEREREIIFQEED